MTAFSQNDIQFLFIGKDVAITTGDPSTLNIGEIGIFKPSGVRMLEADASRTALFRIVSKTTNGDLLDSGIINAADIKTAKLTSWVTSQEMIVNIGYNGTSGAIDEENANTYKMRINLRQSRVSNHGGLYIKNVFYTSSSAGATQFEIASALLLNIGNEFSRETSEILYAEMLCNHAGAALGGVPETLTVTKGSKWVEASGAGHTVVAGDVIRIGGLTTAYPTYKVVSVSGANIELESKYTGVDDSGVAGEVITAANAATADFGIKITGVAEDYVIGKLNQDLNANIFDVLLENFGTTPNVVTQLAKPGVGNLKQVANLEFFLQGNEGDFLRTPEPYVNTRRSEAIETRYNLIDLYVETLDKRSIVTGPIKQRFTLAIPYTMSAGSYVKNATANDITDVMEILSFGAAGAELSLG